MRSVCIRASVIVGQLKFWTRSRSPSFLTPPFRHLTFLPENHLKEPEWRLPAEVRSSRWPRVCVAC